MNETRQVRKVHVTSKATHMISLPKDWVRSSNVRGGDFVELQPHGEGTLLVRVQDPGRLREATLAPGPAGLAWRLLAAYLQGAELLVVPASAAPEGLRSASALARSIFLGAQIQEESDAQIVLRVSPPRAHLTPRQLVQRIANLLEMAHGPAGRSEVLADIDRIYWLLVRMARLPGEPHVEAREAMLASQAGQALRRVARGPAVPDSATRALLAQAAQMALDADVAGVLALSSRMDPALAPALGEFAEVAVAATPPSSS